MNIRTFLVMAAILILTACVSEKDQYVREHQRFAEKFLLEHETYTVTDWEAAEVSYSKLRDQYAIHMIDMSIEERQAIDALNSKIDAIIVRRNIDNAATRLESLINEGIGVIDELIR